jgi:hypothetical protein
MLGETQTQQNVGRNKKTKIKCWEKDKNTTNVGRNTNKYKMLGKTQT